jgi:hypothetical protein
VRTLICSIISIRLVTFSSYFNLSFFGVIKFYFLKLLYPFRYIHTCLRFGGAINQIKCAGDNESGELGQGLSVANIGTSYANMGNNLPFVNLGTGRTVLEVAAGNIFTCTILDTQQVKCFGLNNDGQLGQGSTASQIPSATGQMDDNLPYIKLGTVYSAIGVYTEYLLTCAMLNNQKVKYWGDNGNGELGICSTTNVGTSPSQMGNNLQFIDECPTSAPTLKPTAPTTFPTGPSPVPSQSTSTLAIGITISVAICGAFGIFIWRRRSRSSMLQDKGQVLPEKKENKSGSAIAVLTDGAADLGQQQAQSVATSTDVVYALEVEDVGAGAMISSVSPLSSQKVDVDSTLDLWRDRVDQLEQFYLMNDAKLAAKTEPQLRKFTLGMIENYSFAGIIKNIQKKYPDCELPKKWLDQE